MKKQTESGESNRTIEFETLYIVTYQKLYRHAKLVFNQEDKVKELLILTYMEAYQRGEQLQKEKNPIDWLMKRADFIAETKLEASREMLEASYQEEKMQSREAKKETWSTLDETSVLLEIEDRLGIVDEPEPEKQGSHARTAAQGIFSFVLLVVAVVALMAGVLKVKRQLDILHEPFTRTFQENSDSSMVSATPTGEQKSCIRVGDKAVFLSETGQVLYSLPLEETVLAGEDTVNPEIQMQGVWTYYLPCPERKDSQLKQVQPALHHTLYRIGSKGDELEIIAREVDHYTLWNDAIYVSQYGRIQRISVNDRFETEKVGLYAAVENHEIYLYDTLGRTLKTDANGRILYGDRTFKMESNRIVDVEPGVRMHGQTTYYLKKQDSGDAIYSRRHGRETLFEERGITIDSFCIAGDWIYYSAYMRRGGSGAHYSELYRKSLVRDEKAERLGEEYTGRIRQMYYSEDCNQIYGNYIPKNWKSNHGVIAVISMGGQMSYLDDEELRKEVKTGGNDMLEFVLAQDGEVYCYWKDCYWEKGETPVAIWRKVLVIPNHNRVLMED